MHRNSFHMFSLAIAIGLKAPAIKWLRHLAVALLLLFPAEMSFGQDFVVVGASLQKRADDVLAVMGIQAVPDLTTSSLSIKNPESGNPSLFMSKLGAGSRWSDSFPLYLEGGIAFSRYDPVFVASNGEETLRLPVKWNSVSAGVGIGWDIGLTDDLKLRPIANFNLAYMASDLAILGFVLEDRTGKDLEFLKRGSLQAVGYGGSLVLDYEHYRAEYEIDIELRYTLARLDSFGGSSAVQGHADVSNLNLWSRWRAPIGDWTAFGRPVRYVLELAHSQYLSEDTRVLGFDYLTSLGVGLELDTSARNMIIDRTRFVGRYVFGENVSGFSIGLAVSF